MHPEFRFHIIQSGELFSAAADDTTVLDAAFLENTLTVHIRYDFSETPLTLTAPAKHGDEAALRILPYRIELYVNGVLLDEEWPYGAHALDKAAFRDHGCTLSVTSYTPAPEKEPGILGTFQNAEGWKPEESVFVGDCMPFSHDGVYHVLYLKDRHHHQSKWGRGAHQWNHISTRDFINWDIHPMAVEIDDPAEGSICTGSWIFDGKTHWLFYTVRMCDGSPARICRSFSKDGLHFEKDRGFSFTLSAKYNAPAARDPKIVRDNDGLFHMILTTGLTESKNGCLAHLVSSDLTEWRELDEPLYIAPDDMWEPECPDYFYKDGWYYLVYSLYAKGHYQYSREPFSGWITPKDPIIPCKSVPKAAIWNDRLIFAGFDGSGRYGGTMTFLEAEVEKDGTLSFHERT